MAFNNTTDTTHTGVHSTSHDNSLTGSGHSSLPGTHSTGHNRTEDGGAVDALNPSKGTGTHLPNTSTHATTRDSANPLSHDHQTATTTGHTGTHGSSGLTGSHTHKPEDGGVVDALNPNRGHESHLPGSTGTHTGTTTHSDATHSSHSNNPLSSSTGSHSTTGPHSTTAPHVGHAGATTTESKLPIGNKDGTNAVQTPLNATAAKNVHDTHSSSTTGHSATHGTGTTHGAAAGTGSHDPAHTSKVPMGDKVKGAISSVIGKVTKNPEKVAEGEALKTGHGAHGAAAGTHSSTTGTHSSTTGSHTTGTTGAHSTSTGAHTTGPHSTSTSGTGLATGAHTTGAHTTGTHSNVDNVHHDKHAGFAKEHTSNEGAGTLAGTGTGL